MICLCNEVCTACRRTLCWSYSFYFCDFSEECLSSLPLLGNKEELSSGVENSLNILNNLVTKISPMKESIDVAPTGYSSTSIPYRIDDTTEDLLRREIQQNFQSIRTTPISQYLNQERNYTSSLRFSRRSCDDSGGTTDVHSENRCEMGGARGEREREIEEKRKEQGEERREGQSREREKEGIGQGPREWEGRGGGEGEGEGRGGGEGE